jgi:hypothetical protein
MDDLVTERWSHSDSEYRSGNANDICDSSSHETGKLVRHQFEMKAADGRLTDIQPMAPQDSSARPERGSGHADNACYRAGLSRK